MQRESREGTDFSKEDQGRSHKKGKGHWDDQEDALLGSLGAGSMVGRGCQLLCFEILHRVRPKVTCPLACSQPM